MRSGRPGVRWRARAEFLLGELLDEARRKGAPVPYSANTPYVNTIPPESEPPHPGDRAIEHRIRSLYPLERAGDRAARQQGILASSAATSPASSRRRRSTTSASCISGTPPTEQHGGDLIYFQGHCSPGHLRARLPRGPAQRGAAAQLPPGSRRQGPVLLSASLADAGLLAVPDRLDGPRAR